MAPLRLVHGSHCQPCGAGGGLWAPAPSRFTGPVKWLARLRRCLILPRAAAGAAFQKHCAIWEPSGSHKSPLSMGSKSGGERSSLAHAEPVWAGRWPLRCGTRALRAARLWTPAFLCPHSPCLCGCPSPCVLGCALGKERSSGTVTAVSAGLFIEPWWEGGTV